MARLKPLDLPVSATANFSSIDPLDGRYFDTESTRYLSERSRIFYQAYMEAALAHTLAEFDICSADIAAEIESASRKTDPEVVYSEEKITKHDVKALVNSIKNQISNEAKPYVHFGATSYDIVASASALQMRDCVRMVILPRLTKLLQTLIKLTEEYADTVQIGRTHGQHAVPITFGFAMAEYVERIGNSTEAISEVAEALPGKFSGAVGSYNALKVFVDDPLNLTICLWSGSSN